MNSKLKGKLDDSRWSEGIVDYVEDGRSVSFWCRPTHIPGTFVYIYAPFPISWREKCAWAAEQREEITALAIDYIRSRFPPSTAEFESENIILLRQADEKAT